jgi:tetratricopeptide (TPR) repeat protein
MASRSTLLAATGALAVAVLGLAAVAVFMAFRPPAAAPVQDAPAAAGGTPKPDLSSPTGESPSGTPAGAATSPAAEAAMRLADSSIASGDFPAAVATLEKAVASAPRQQALRLKLAEALIHQRQLDQAVTHMVEAIAIGPDAPALHFDLATVASAAGQFDLSIKHYEIAQARSPKDPRPPLYAAMVHLRRGDSAKARAQLVRAVALDDNLAEAWGTLADIELRENRVDLAMQHITRARTLQPEVASWKLVQARIQKRDNQPQAAAQLLMTLPDGERLTGPVLQTISESFGLLSRADLAAEQYELAYQRERSNETFARQAALWVRRAGNQSRADEVEAIASRLAPSAAPAAAPAASAPAPGGG